MNESGYRIAMVAPGPFPALRGSQVLVRELAEALVADGHSVHVIAYGGEPEVAMAGVHVHRTPALLGGTRLYGPGGWRLVLNLLLLRTLYEVVRREKIEVIHAHNYEAPVLGYAVRALTGVPVVYHSHNVMSDELGHYFRGRTAKRLARAIGMVLDRSIPRRANYVVALSEPMAAFLRDNGVASDQLAVIPPGVRLDDHADRPSSSEPDPYPGSKVILYAGNLDPYQDLPTLLRAMPQVGRAEPDALLVVVTHASHGSGMREASRLRLSPDVQVVLAPDFALVRSLLRRADLVVCPRTSWSGFPIKLLNYMAAGRAIVAAAGAASAVRGGPMVVFPNDNADELAHAIIATLRDPVGRAEMGRAARELASRSFAWPLLVRRIVQVYQDVVDTGPGKTRNLQNCKKVLQKATHWGLMEGMGDRVSAPRQV